MDHSPTERSRAAIIASVLTQMYTSHTSNISVMDIGCGEGIIADYLPWYQKKRYVGVDISAEAIQRAQLKRGTYHFSPLPTSPTADQSSNKSTQDDIAHHHSHPNRRSGQAKQLFSLYPHEEQRFPLQFIQSTAHHYHPPHPFDVIIFSEVLYYTEYETLLNQYDAHLTKPDGILIISIYRDGPKLYPKMEAIFSFAREKYHLLDSIDIDGYITRNQESRSKTGFHIEVFRRKSNNV